MSKIRKPPRKNLGAVKSIAIEDVGWENHPIKLSCFAGCARFSISEAKDLHKWLSKAIKYVEAK